jgi:hypothetical protein
MDGLQSNEAGTSLVSITVLSVTPLRAGRLFALASVDPTSTAYGSSGVASGRCASPLARPGGTSLSRSRLAERPASQSHSCGAVKVQYPMSSRARIGAIGDLRARECRAFQGSSNVDIVGVTGSIPVAPTIPARRLSAEFHVEAEDGSGAPAPTRRASALRSRRAGQGLRGSGIAGIEEPALSTDSRLIGVRREPLHLSSSHNVDVAGLAIAA